MLERAQLVSSGDSRPTLLPQMPRQIESAHLCRLPNPDRPGTNRQCAGKTVACGTLRLCEMRASFQWIEAFREAWARLLRKRLFITIRGLVLRL